MDFETITYADKVFPGAFFPEHSVEEVDRRDPARIARESSEQVYAFTFYDVLTVDAREGIPLRSDPQNESGRYYIDAVKITTEDVEALEDLSAKSQQILLSNMRGNGWDVIVRCRTGNFQPYQKGDRIVSSTTGEVSE